MSRFNKEDMLQFKMLLGTENKNREHIITEAYICLRHMSD